MCLYRLGLGAKFLPHSRAAALTHSFERKVHRKLTSMSDLQKEEALLQQDHEQSSDGEESDEEVGKAGAVCKRSAGGTTGDAVVNGASLSSKKLKAKKSSIAGATAASSTPIASFERFYEQIVSDAAKRKQAEEAK